MSTVPTPNPPSGEPYWLGAVIASTSPLTGKQRLEVTFQGPGLDRSDLQLCFDSLAEASSLVRVLNLAYTEGFNAALQQLLTPGNSRTM